jgi:hypothetical protein
MQEKFGKWFYLFEKELKCSGMCTKVPYFLFTGTNNGIPSENCEIAITNSIVSESGKYAGWSFFFAFVGSLSLVTAIGMFYVERKKFMPESFYKYSKWGI